MILLVIIVIVLLFTGIPNMPYGYNSEGSYGAWPSGLWLILLIILILYLTGLL